MQHAVAGLSIGLILIDPRDRILWLNRAAERLLGIRADEAVGRHYSRVMRDPRLTAFWHDAGCRDGNCMADVSIQWPKPAELKLNATTCHAEDGTEIGRALLFCDVTTERQVKIEMTSEVASRLLDLAGPPGELPRQLAGLTPSELRTLRLLARGMSNDEIAGHLSVASSTVRSHLKSIYRKLDLGSRAEAVSFAARHNLA